MSLQHGSTKYAQLNLCIEKCDPTPFEEFNEATRGTIPHDFTPSSADRLVMLSEDIPYLLRQEKTMYEEPDILKRQEIADALMSDCVRIEELLSYWSSMVPPQFQFTSLPLPKSSPQSPYETLDDVNMYPNSLDIYCDNTMASTWNTWRVTRIRILRITLHCLDITNPPHPAMPRPPEYQTSLTMIHRLIDEICSTVPFLLGFHKKRIGDHGAFQCFPHPPGEAKWPDNFAASGAVGGWLMMQPLSFVAQLEETPESQRRWVKEYLTTFLRDPKDMGQQIGSPPKT